MQIVKTIEKDANATLDYGVRWSKWLGTDTITNSEWIIPTGLTSSNESHGSGTTIVWLSGGTLNETYTIINRITTAAGRIDDRSIKIKIVKK